MDSKPLLKKVFFIDDDEATNAYHKALAKDFNLAEDVQFFGQATEALDVLEAIESKYEFPQLIFVDINMPSMTGHEFAERVQDMDGYNENRHSACREYAIHDVGQWDFKNHEDTEDVRMHITVLTTLQTTGLVLVFLGGLQVEKAVHCNHY